MSSQESFSRRPLDRTSLRRARQPEQNLKRRRKQKQIPTSIPTPSTPSKKWAPISIPQGLPGHRDITHDDVLDDGLIVQSDSKVDMLAAKPNRMRVEVTGDDKAQTLSLRRQKLHRLGEGSSTTTLPFPHRQPSANSSENRGKVRHRPAPHRPLQMGNQRGRYQQDQNRNRRRSHIRRGCNLRAICLPPGRRRLADLDSARTVSSAAQVSHHDPHRRRQAAAQHHHDLEPRALLQRRSLRLRSAARCQAHHPRRRKADATEKGK